MSGYKKPTNLRCFEAITCYCPLFSLHLVPQEGKSRAEEADAIALQFQWQEEQTALIFWGQFITKSEWKGLCKWRTGPETGRLKADSQQHVVHLVVRNVWFFQGVWIYPLHFFCSADEKLGNKEARFQFLKQWRSQDVEMREGQRVLVQNNSEVKSWCSLAGAVGCRALFLCFSQQRELHVQAQSLLLLTCMCSGNKQLNDLQVSN